MRRATVSRSGTIALTLCRNGIPKWNLVMDQGLPDQL